MRIGLIARSDHTGLGNQTRNLAYMLKPSKILVVDSRSFSDGNVQHDSWYSGFNAYKTQGWPTNYEVRSFLRGIDVLVTAETFYNPLFITMAKSLGIKTFSQYNFEFLDNLRDRNYPKPDLFLAPSYWNVEEMKEYGITNVKYLPPPTDPRRFAEARQKNFRTNGKVFLHIAGKRAAHDRNGTDVLLSALQYTKSQFKLVIRAQFDQQFPTMSNDSRVTYSFENVEDESELYKEFDAMIMPRKYGGLCLPMNEALMSGLPVIMTNTSPNNKVLPEKWLVDCYTEQMIMTRTLIPAQHADLKALAAKIDWLCEADLGPEKIEAFEIGYNNYSYDSLRGEYEKVLCSV